MKKLSETEKAYLAGLFDGDGCIVIRKQKQYAYPGRIQHVMCAILTMSDKPILEFWVNKFGIGSVAKLKDKRARRSVYQWRLSAKNADSMLRIIYPYLMVKKDQADLAFKFRETIGASSNKSKYKSKELWQHTLDIREELMLELRELKKTDYRVKNK